jgi:hypothetical protein
MSHVKKMFVVIEATCALRPKLHHHWQVVFHAGLLVVVQTNGNPMELGPDYVEAWGKFKFRLTDCFNGSCRRMRMRVIVEQINPLWTADLLL